MKLNDKYSIVKDGDGITLLEKTIIKVTKNGKKTGQLKHGNNKRFYGTVYQALQGFVRVCADTSIKSNTDIMEEVGKALFVIDQANKIIKTEFCIEVKSVRP